MGPGASGSGGPCAATGWSSGTGGWVGLIPVRPAGAGRAAKDRRVRSLRWDLGAVRRYDSNS